MWARSYLAIDEQDPRRQHYLWISRLQARADDLVAYAKTSEWTGSGELERLSVHGGELEWLGQHPIIRGQTDTRAAYHISHTGRHINSRDELTLQYSERGMTAITSLAPFFGYEE